MGCVASLACCAACACCEGVCRACCACGTKTKEGHVNPDAGRVGSMWVMILAIVFSLIGQYYLPVRHLDYYAFNQGCDTNACKGAAAVYRVSCCTAIFFVSNATVSWLDPSFHDRRWVAKLLGWLLFLCISLLIPNPVFGLDGYVWVARFGGFIFVILQQILLIDLAYWANDTLVAIAEEDVDLWCGYPSPLVALLVGALILYVAAIVGIALLFTYFSGDCPAPDTILSITLILVVFATLSQLFVSKDANLLTSSVVAVYLVNLASSAVAANPVTKCNEFHRKGDDWVSVFVGLFVTLIVLAYSVYSASASVKYLQDGRPAADNAPGGDTMHKMLTGQIDQRGKPTEDNTDDYDATRTAESVESQSDDDTPISQKTPAEVLSFNVVMALMAMYLAMVLTNWGSLEKAGNAAAPSAGQVAMWIIAASQWVAGLLYIWTCVAPSLFPGREFS